MTDEELKRLLYDIESDRVERKASLSDKDKICQAICAFANDLPNHNSPGVIFIGANDDGGSANTPITEKIILDLSNIRSDGNILPFPSMTVEKRRIGESDFAIVIVEPSYMPPVRYKGVTWIRIGSRRAIATLEEEMRLSEKRQSRSIPFDISIMEIASLSNLDLDYFERGYLPKILPQEVLNQNSRTTEQKLTALRFSQQKNGKTIPTVLGILTLGSDITYFLPGAYIQFVRFDGESLTDPIKDEKRIEGILSEILKQLDNLLKLNIYTAIDYKTKPTEIRKPDYPLEALQQIVRNAIMHRNYQSYTPVKIYWFSDRIEVYSPGGLYGEVNQENFGSVSSYRNPNLAEVMKMLGYVQKFGLGLSIANEALKRNGNPPFKPLIKSAYVTIIIRKAK